MRTSGARQKQKQATRDRILAAALASFRADGFLVTKTEDVARRAGVAHGTIFVHFATRETLLAEAIDAAADVVVRATREALKHAASVEDVLVAHLSALASDEELFVHVARESFALPERARAVIVEINSVVSMHLAALLAKEPQCDGAPAAFVFNMWL